MSTLVHWDLPSSIRKEIYIPLRAIDFNSFRQKSKTDIHTDRQIKLLFY